MKYSGLNGCSVLVTGGTRGIGHAIASAFLDQEAEVHVTGKKKNGKGPQDSIYHFCDFTNKESLEDFCYTLKQLDLRMQLSFIKCLMMQNGILQM